MASPASLTFGIIGLAGAFNNAVNCFRFVRLGQAFEADFTTCVIQLDLANLRLTRWGNAVGLSEVNDEDGSPSLNVNCAEGDVATATKALQHIAQLFNNAQTATNKISGEKAYEHTDRLVGDDRELHSRLENLSLSRLSKVKGTAKAKTKWALYKQAEFSSLIKSIVDTISQLESTIKPQQNQVEETSRTELTSIMEGNTNRLNVLAEVVERIDTSLAAAIAKVQSEQKDKATNIMHSTNNSGQQTNVNTGTMAGYFGRGPPGS